MIRLDEVRSSWIVLAAVSVDYLDRRVLESDLRSLTHHGQNPPRDSGRHRGT
jgi:hypothetical protein